MEIIKKIYQKRVLDFRFNDYCKWGHIYANGLEHLVQPIEYVDGNRANDSARIKAMKVLLFLYRVRFFITGRNVRVNNINENNYCGNY